MTVAPVDTEGVELEDLPSEVLIQPAAPPATAHHRRVGSDALVIVEVHEHYRMCLDSHQHVVQLTLPVQSGDVIVATNVFITDFVR